MTELHLTIHELFKDFCFNISLDELSGNQEVIENVQTVEIELLSLLNANAQGAE